MDMRRDRKQCIASDISNRINEFRQKRFDQSRKHWCHTRVHDFLKMTTMHVLPSPHKTKTIVRCIGTLIIVITNLISASSSIRSTGLLMGRCHYTKQSCIAHTIPCVHQRCRFATRSMVTILSLDWCATHIIITSRAHCFTAPQLQLQKRGNNSKNNITECLETAHGKGKWRLHMIEQWDRALPTYYRDLKCFDEWGMNWNGAWFLASMTLHHMNPSEVLRLHATSHGVHLSLSSSILCPVDIVTNKFISAKREREKLSNLYTDMQGLMAEIFASW